MDKFLKWGILLCCTCLAALFFMVGSDWLGFGFLGVAAVYFFLDGTIEDYSE